MLQFHEHDILRKVIWLAGKSTMNEDVFPIEDGDFPASHVFFCFFSEVYFSKRWLNHQLDGWFYQLSFNAI